MLSEFGGEARRKGLIYPIQQALHPPGATLTLSELSSRQFRCFGNEEPWDAPYPVGYWELVVAPKRSVVADIHPYYIRAIL